MSKKKKIIAVYSLKGGVGKTSISSNLALTMGYGIITNDIYSPVDKILPEGSYLKLLPEQPVPAKKDLAGHGIIIDFGGYLDIRVRDVLEMSDYVLVPIIEADDLNVQGLISTLAEISEITKKIIIILNKMDKKQAELIRAAMKKAGYNYPAFEIKSSRALMSVIKQKKSIEEMVRGGGLSAYLYENVEKQFHKLVEFLEK